MKQNELIPNNWYYWNDPDDGLTSQPVKYLESSFEPGVVDVAGEIGTVFSVLVDELTESPDTGTLPLYNRDLSKLAFVPMYWFKSLNNMRISETGFVLMDVSDRDPMDINSRITTTTMFDIKTISRLEHIRPKFVQGADGNRMNPAEDTIFIEHTGGTLYLRPGVNAAPHLFNVLNQLRLYFAGFLVSMADLELEFTDAAPATKGPMEHLEDVLAATIRDKTSCPSSKSIALVNNYITIVKNKLAQVCPGWSGVGVASLNEADGFYYARFAYTGDGGTTVFDLSDPAAKGTFLRLEEMVANERRG